MNHLKDYHISKGILHFLTFADQNAIGESKIIFIWNVEIISIFLMSIFLLLFSRFLWKTRIFQRYKNQQSSLSGLYKGLWVRYVDALRTESENHLYRVYKCGQKTKEVCETTDLSTTEKSVEGLSGSDVFQRRYVINY